jgi:hypothetical protein
MFIDIYANQDKVLEAKNRLLDFADGMDRAFSATFEGAVWESKETSLREVKTMINIEEAESEIVQAVPFFSETRLGREANLKLLDRSIPMRAFKASQTPTGVELQLTRAGTSKVFYPGHFGPKIVKLAGNIYHRAGKKRFPIVKVADIKVSKIDGVPSTFRESVKKYKVKMVERLEQKKKQLIQEYGKGIVNAATQT